MENGKVDEKPGFHEPCELDRIKGGMSQGFTIKDIASKHGVPIEDIEEQVSMGMVMERKEHTEKGDKVICKEIAMDHLCGEHPYYYNFLKKMEKEMAKDYEAHSYGMEEKPRGKPGAREEEASKDNLEDAKKKLLDRLFG